MTFSLQPKLVINDQEDFFVKNPQRQMGQKIWVIPRSGCSFRRERVQGRGKKALTALKLKLKQEASELNKEFRIVKDGDTSSVGVWFLPLMPEGYFRSLPETLVYAPPVSGTHIIKCYRGYEGQVWKDDTLLDSRWWPEKPTDRQWMTFMRASHAEELDLPAEAQPMIRTDLPGWEFGEKTLSYYFSPEKIMKGIIVLFLPSFVFFAGKNLKLDHDLNGIKTELQVKTKIYKPILETRERVTANMNEIQKHINLGQEGALLMALADLSVLTSLGSVNVENIQFNNQQLSMMIAGDLQRPMSEVVDLLEDQNHIENVTFNQMPGGRFLVKVDVN